jgi:hypothetical protein
MDFVVIKIPFAELVTNEVIQQLAVAALLGGAKAVGTVNGLTTYTGISNNDNTYAILDREAVAYIVSLGGEVLNYQSFIKVDLEENVPSFIRDFETTNEEGETINLKWGNWIHTNKPATIILGDTYISGYARNAGFRAKDKPQMHLTGTELGALIDAGFTVLNKNEFITLLKENTDEPI